MNGTGQLKQAWFLGVISAGSKTNRHANRNQQGGDQTGQPVERLSATGLPGFVG